MDTTHYSLAQKPGELLKWAQEAARHLQAFSMNNNVTPLLVYRGMSGVATATALSLAAYQLGLQVDMAYVRKQEEQSHGEAIEISRSYETMPYALVFVDDFISSGSTFRACREAMQSSYSYLTEGRNWYTLCHKINTEVIPYFP